MALHKQNYDVYVKQKSPDSPVIKDVVKAFLIGGAICTIGQGILNAWKLAGLDETKSAMLTTATLILIGAVLTGIGLYDKIAKHAGAGTIVPVTGFSNAVVSAALEYKTEGFILGMSANLFKIAGPVIVYGTIASVVYGVIYWVTTLL